MEIRFLIIFLSSSFNAHKISSDALSFLSDTGHLCNFLFYSWVAWLEVFCFLLRFFKETFFFSIVFLFSASLICVLISYSFSTVCLNCSSFSRSLK